MAGVWLDKKTADFVRKASRGGLRHSIVKFVTGDKSWNMPMRKRMRPAGYSSSTPSRPTSTSTQRRKRLRISRKPAGSGRSNRNSGLFSYRRQSATTYGTSGRAQRRLAKSRTVARYKGSATNAFLGSNNLIIPADATSPTAGSGSSHLCAIGVNLGTIINERLTNAPITTAASGALTQRINSIAHSIEFTPNWTGLGATTTGVFYEIWHFSLKDDMTFNELWGATDGARTTNPCLFQHVMIPGASGTTPPAGLFEKYVAGLGQRVASSTAALTVAQATHRVVTLFDSPDFMSAFRFHKMKKIYIPYGQAMTYSWIDPGLVLSYRDLNISTTSTTSTACSTTVPNYPRGYRFIVLRQYQEVGSATLATQQFVVSDAFQMSTRITYTVPDYFGRDLNYNAGDVTATTNTNA